MKIVNAMAVFIFVVMVAGFAHAEDFISFRGDGSAQQIPSSKLGEFAKPQTLKVFEPHDRSMVTYRGYPTKEILDKVFGSRWKKADVIVFACRDGYKSPVPRVKIESENSLLSFARADQHPFIISNHSQNEKDVSLAPLYLVWDDLKGVYESEDGSFWPYEITGIELATFAEKFPNIVPSPKASASAVRGFKVFQTHCLSCHQINGNGGDKGPELNYPLSVTEQRSDQWLRSWIDNPAKVLFGNDKAKGPTMPPLNKNLENRAGAIDDVISYLKEMSKKKIKPKA